MAVRASRHLAPLAHFCVYSVNRFDPCQILWIIRIEKAGISCKNSCGIWTLVFVSLPNRKGMTDLSRMIVRIFFAWLMCFGLRMRVRIMVDHGKAPRLDFKNQTKVLAVSRSFPASETVA